MKQSATFFVLLIGLFLCQVVLSKSCDKNSGCTSTQCCLMRDGATRCRPLARKGSECSSDEKTPDAIHSSSCPCRGNMICLDEGGRQVCR
ncbi:peptide 1-like [Stegodyphus dumicola]|uniref:peptide 1-like n=1 Tax=Stegodyphus dumicola TaxID=202533 RepID=UPI0015AC609A|nr:peptide 1-like [Stegodyphus dumicola]